MSETRRRIKFAKLTLPPELILEIFLRLPTKSLDRLTCVLDDHPVLSKELKSSSYRHKHATKVMTQQANQQLIMNPSSNSGRDELHVINPSETLLTGQINRISYAFEQLFNDIVLRYGEKTFSAYNVIGGCNGLVCLYFEIFPKPEPLQLVGGGLFYPVCRHVPPHGLSYHFILWNPCTGEHHALPTPQNMRFNLRLKTGFRDPRPTISGFGYDVVKETYKLLLGEGSVTILYDLSSNLWESANHIDINWYDFDFFKYPKTTTLSYSSMVHHFGHYDLNGSLYWIVSNTTVVSVDLSTQVSTRLKLPHGCSSEFPDLDLHRLGMGVLKGSLSVFCFRHEVNYEVSIWVLEEIGGREELWKNVFTVNLPNSIRIMSSPLWMSQDEEMMLFLLKDDALGYWNLKAEDFTSVKHEIPGFTYITRGILHVDTLVSPKPEDYGCSSQ